MGLYKSAFSLDSTLQLGILLEYLLSNLTEIGFIITVR